MATNSTAPVFEVMPPATTQTGVSPIQFNIGTTLRSPFFWLVVGLAAGVWLCKTRKI